MTNDDDPITLEFAPLPREEIGPFFLLGVDKDAGSAEIEANWAQRVIWARKKQIGTALGDVNWARETINDPQRRVRADVTSLNADTAAGVLRRLAEPYERAASGTPAWQPADAEQPLSEYQPADELPRSDEVRATITVPVLPKEWPAVQQLLRQFTEERIDPWTLEIPASQDRTA